MVFRVSAMVDSTINNMDTIAITCNTIKQMVVIVIGPNFRDLRSG